MSWQPIETAPKDGRWILLHGDGAGFMKCTYVGYWGRVNSTNPLLFGDQDAWRMTFGGELTHPTKWQPLPDVEEGE